MNKNKYIVAALLVSLCGLASAAATDAQKAACRDSIKNVSSAQILDKGAPTGYYNCKVTYVRGNVLFELPYTPNPRATKDNCFVQARAAATAKCNAW